MAAQSDVESALALLAERALYPAGIGSAPSVAAASVRIYRGWPNQAALDADLTAGRVNVTIFPVPNAVHVTTRALLEWLPDPVVPKLTVTVAGTTASFAGDATAGQLAGILVEGQSYVHRCGAGETPALVAATLAAAIAADRPAIAAGPTLSLPGAPSLVARTVADANASLELRRQVQSFRITAWCPTPALRDETCDALDVAIAATPFLVLVDATPCRLRGVSSTSFDQRQDAALYRRDLVVTVEYPTTQAAIQPSMLFGTLGLGALTLTA